MLGVLRERLHNNIKIIFLVLEIQNFHFLVIFLDGHWYRKWPQFILPYILPYFKVESSGRSRFFFSFSMRSVYNSPSSWRADKLEISSFTGTILLYYFPDMENNKANNCCSLLRVNMCHLCDMSQLHCFRRWEAGSQAELNH